MAYSYQVTILSALSSGPFYFTDIDGYLSISHIKVYKDGVLQTSGYTINESAKSVTFSVPLPASTVVRIERQTPKTVSGRITDFADGSVLTAQDLDNSSIQNLYIAQEAEDNGSGALGPSLDDLAWDAQNKQIKNVSSPTAPGDAVNKLYIDGFQLGNQAWTVPQAWTFTGTGQTTFAWSTGGQPTPTTTDPRMLIVEVGGVIQHPTINYTVTETNITFAGAVGSVGTPVDIRVRNFGVSRDVPNWTSPITFTDTMNVSGLATLSSGAVIDGISINNSSGNDSSSIFIGDGANFQTVGSKFNTVVGKSSLTSVTTGINNTVFGNGSLQSSTTASGNTAIGSLALRTGAFPGTHTNSVAVGYQAGYNVNSPILNNSIYIGAQTTPSGTAGTTENEIVIGQGNTGDGSNTTKIGNSSTTQTKLAGNLITTGTGTSAIGGALEVNGNITLKAGGTGALAAGLLPVGAVLQVVHATSQSNTTLATVGTFLDCGVSASITPTRTTSKILILANVTTNVGGNVATAVTARFARSIGGGAYTALSNSDHANLGYGTATANIQRGSHSMMYFDSPNSTASITYRIEAARAGVTGGTCEVGAASTSTGQSRHNIVLVEIA